MSEADPQTVSAAPKTFKIPAVVKRNTILLALSQAFVGAGMQMMPTLGPLLILQLTGLLSLGGVPTTLTYSARFFVSYPLGKIMDAYGRRAGLVFGLCLGLVGPTIIGISALRGSFPGLLAGMLIFGMGMAAAQQLRLAAADMYPRSRRAEGLGYVLSGSLLGALGGPLIVSVGEMISPALVLDAKALAFLLVPVVILPAILLVFKMRPDPKEIATNMGHYYPGYQEPALAQPATGAASESRKMPYAKLVAFVAAAAVQGNMAMIMAMTSVALAHHGFSLPVISFSVALHVIGMYGLSLPLGRLTDMFGRRNLIIVGLMISAFGAALVPTSSNYWLITAGTFLVGVGWSGVSVAATAIIADTTAPLLRGRAVGMNDMISFGAGGLLGLSSGPLVEYLGMPSLGVAAVLVVAVPMVMAFRLREPRPGTFLHSADGNHL